MQSTAGILCIFAGEALHIGNLPPGLNVLPEDTDNLDDFKLTRATVLCKAGNYQPLLKPTGNRFLILKMEAAAWWASCTLHSHEATLVKIDNSHQHTQIATQSNSLIFSFYFLISMVL